MIICCICFTISGVRVVDEELIVDDGSGVDDETAAAAMEAVPARQNSSYLSEESLPQITIRPKRRYSHLPARLYKKTLPVPKSQLTNRPILQGFEAQNSSFEATLRTLSAMLPKGAPLPPSGPNPGIN
ncbi:hypothetical protein SADUNF_Sadunf19G0102100 [Salix dunnii]|uniref:Uncharacterized protein n=1 Tax=Salix dunnii TaxID=1413687 RepID=A0A835MI46_9ROSI|nr:hypothetical protein SADUNF_Sadunf19G0102100 [Salix dunnii]